MERREREKKRDKARQNVPFYIRTHAQEAKCKINNKSKFPDLDDISHSS